MKNFTLRLTDNEAEALERMAAFSGKSKNSFLRNYLAHAYRDQFLDADGICDYLEDYFEDVFNELSAMEVVDTIFHWLDTAEFSNAEEKIRVLPNYVGASRLIDYFIKSADKQGLSKDEVSELKKIRENVIKTINECS